MQNLPKLIVIVGPTGSGKSALALRLAKELGGEVIAADSRTVYKGMDIGTAKPVGRREGVGVREEGLGIEMLFAERPMMVEGVAHWGIDLVNPDEDFTVSDFKDYADKKIGEIVARGAVPILVGGTGLYVNAVIDNLTFSETPPDLILRDELEKLSNDDLLARIKEKDPDTAETIDAFNRRRLVRALEIIETTGAPVAKTRAHGEAKYEVLMLGLDVDRATLRTRLDERVDVMIASGLIDEVRRLAIKFGYEAPGLNAIGYREIIAFLHANIKLKEAIELIKRDTWHYARRQMTWWRRDERIIWLTSNDPAGPWTPDPDQHCREFLS